MGRIYVKKQRECQEIGRVSGNREDVSFSINQIQATSLETLP